MGPMRNLAIGIEVVWDVWDDEENVSRKLEAPLDGASTTFNVHLEYN
jgi:hypothetical protein